MITLKEEESLFLTLYDSSSEDYFFVSSYKKEEKIKSFLEENKGLIIRSEEFSEKTLSKLKLSLDHLKKLGFLLKGKMIAFQMPHEQYLTTEELKYLVEIDEFLTENGAELVIKAEELFYLDQIIATNERLNIEIDYINSLTVPTENNRPLNQFEKFLLAYDFCTNFKYNECEENRSKARYITSILSGDKIVCVGYASLLAEMCKRLGIECVSVGVSCYDEITKQKEGHQNNIVVLNNKIYYADSCWDSQREGDRGLKLYNHCLIPMTDKDKIKDVIVDYTEYDNNLASAKKDLEIAKRLLKNIQSEDFNDRECSNFTYKYHAITDNLKDLNIGVDNFSFTRTMKIIEEKNLECIIEYLEARQPGEAIQYEEFEKALYNIYIAKGMSERAAQSLLDRTMEANRKRALKCFNNEAQNCFVSARINELEI